MGSNQSSSTAGGNQPDLSFSIDPSGNITRRLAHIATNDIRQQQQQYSDNNSYSDDTIGSEGSGSQPLKNSDSQTLTNPTKGGDDADGLSLKEADEITSRLKDKYKPEAAEMAGKHHSIFEEIERNLVQCYKSNKNSPMNCSKIFKEYKDYVGTQRSQLLKQQSVNISPLITTILVIVTCLLLHINTVDCYGAMSIDLGSEWMKVGLVAPSVQMDIVLNAASQRKTPMAIAFSNGERFVGDTALDVASKYPEKTFTHFLDLAGKTIEHESVQQYKQRFPYANITSHEPNSTSIILNHPEGLSFTPLELIAMMIQHAHDQVTNRLSNNEPASDVVITVPPFFDSTERRVIKDAAKLVGLNVLRLTNVNSAFALSYGIFRHKDYLPESSVNKTTILFFDQGASHTSVSLADYHLVEHFDNKTGLNKNESIPTITIRAQVYDRYLGGFDMQLKLREYLIRSFVEKTKIGESRIYKRGKSLAKLLKESGRVKKILSANNDHIIRIENVIDDRDLRQPITRQEYEEINQEYLGQRLTQLLDRLFELPEVNRNEQLSSVIIVGGNTRTPKIQQVLMDYFKLETLGKSINADEGAALAALYQAASLGRGFRVKKFVLEEFGKERKRSDSQIAEAAAAAAAVLSTTIPSTTDASTTMPSTDVASTTTDPNSIYSESELERIRDRLAHMREQDFSRLERLSLRNSLESLLSEGREKLNEDHNEQLKDKRDEIEKLIAGTYSWLEDGPIEETDNLKNLAEKYNSIRELIHPRPPPPPPPPQSQFDPSTVDLSKVLNNETLNILDVLNFTNPFEHPSPLESNRTSILDPVQQQQQQLNESSGPNDKLGPPPHSEL